MEMQSSAKMSGSASGTSGSVTDFHPELTFKGYTKVRSKLLIVTSVFSIFFFITTVIFVVLFAYNYIMVSIQFASMVRLCMTPDCVMTGAAMARKMNMSVDPCQDFNEFACGRYNKEAVIPEHMTGMSIFSATQDENLLILKDIVTEEIADGEHRYLSNMKRLYMSCMNTKHIEQVGYQLFLSDPLVMDWPTLNTTWNGQTFNLASVIAHYMDVRIEPIVTFYVDSDLKNSSRNVIYLEQPQYFLPMEYFSRPMNDTVIMALHTYLTDTAIELGAPMNVADKDAKDVVDLMTALSMIMVPKEETRDYNKLYNPVNLTDLSTIYPELDIPGALMAAFSTADIELSEDETIIDQFPSYYGNISRVIKQFSNRTLHNLFGFMYAITRVGHLTMRMKEISLEFDKAFTGRMAEGPKWKSCIHQTNRVFYMGMGKLFVERAFPETSKIYMEGMVANLKMAFKHMLEENTWIGQATKDEAFKKLAAIKQHIGYPTEDFEHSDIEEAYENYTMFENDFYENLQLMDKLLSIENLLSLLKEKETSETTNIRRSTFSPFHTRKVNREGFEMGLFEVNAGYNPLGNEIHIPAGILRPPFFSPNFPESLNYGAIGLVIGHEITHGFDDQGSQFDEVGNMRNWWQKSDMASFTERTKCIVNQNSGFFVEEVKMRLNGINTQGESVADNGGLQESFRAYKELTRQGGDRPMLPGLGLTHDQLFFLSFSQSWCSKMTKEMLTLLVTVDEHPPGKYRIIGTLQNSEDFAKAYNCPLGSYMNPEKKCRVW